MRSSVALLLCGCLAAVPCASFAQDQASQKAPFLPALDDAVRKASTDTLQQTVYDLVQLQANTHQAHWNVVGSDYYQLHEFYQELYTGLDPYIDQSAERIRALGPAADARLGPTSEATTIPSIEAGELQGATTNRTLAEQWKIMSTELYDGMQATDDDMVTQDLLISIAHFVDKGLWQLWAHLEAGQ